MERNDCVYLQSFPSASCHYLTSCWRLRPQSKYVYLALQIHLFFPWLRLCVLLEKTVFLLSQINDTLVNMRKQKVDDSVVSGHPDGSI